MTEKRKEIRRGELGYGSSYRKGAKQELMTKGEIPVVLGSQVWMVKPDKHAKTSNPCLWMQAGVAGFKNCNNFFDCTTCKYDLGMLKRVKDGKQISWQRSI